MRPALAALLLTAIGLPLIAPLLLADSRPDRPACCGRNGKHHCALAAQSDGQAEAAPAIKSLRAKCSFLPKPGAAPVDSKRAIAAIRSLVGPADRVEFQIDQRSSSLPRIPNRGGERKRGPPPAFS